VTPLNDVLTAMLTDLVHAVWRKTVVPQDWLDARYIFLSWFPRRAACFVGTIGGE